MHIEKSWTTARITSKLVLSLFAAQTSATAAAQEVGDVYLGFAYSEASAKDTSSKNLGTFKPTTAGLSLGVIALPNLALDGFVFTGLNDSTHSLPANSRLTVRIKEGYGFNLRPYLSLNNSWGVFAKLGKQFGSQETTLVRGAIQQSTSTRYARTIYGLGVSYNLDTQWGIGADYTWSKHLASEQTSSSSINLGVRYKF